MKNAGSDLAQVADVPFNANSHQDMTKKKSLGLDQFENHLPEPTKSGFNTDRHGANNANKDELIQPMIYQQQKNYQIDLKKTNING